MAFPLERILTISAEAYCKIKNKRLEDYNAVPVHAQQDSILKVRKTVEYGKGIRSIFPKVSSKVIRRGDIRDFAELVPSEAEVVVDYRQSIGGGIGSITFTHTYSGSGTALIPKSNNSKG